MILSTIQSTLSAGWKSVSSVFSRSKSNVAGQTEQTKTSVNSRPSTSPSDGCITARAECTERLADAVKAKSKLLKPQTGPLPVYKVPLNREQSSLAGCKRFSFGKESTKPNRTIMVLGATGAGKSTLINGMINYILGVEWDDSYRFKLVDEGQSTSQAESQTSEVTVYKIHHQQGFKVDYSLTIVDTPGFGDTRGIKRDKEITEQLLNLFSDQLGVSEIDAVCFVAQAALARLTPSQKYVFDSVLSIFGKDIAENIRVLVTFADGQRPPVLEAIKASGVPCPKTRDGLPVHFKFNNSALFADNKSSAAGSTSDGDEDGGFDQMFWNMGTKSMKRFFVALNVIKTKSLIMTKEVLRERKQLENSVENLQKQVKLGLAKLEEIKETSEKLKEHEAEISRNEDFEFEVTVTKPVEIDISGSGSYITNCQQCHFTCHHPCQIPNDADKHGCAAMGSDGHCKQCPGKCYWKVHFNQKYRWEYKEVKEKRTVQELKEKYLIASEAKTPVEALVGKLRSEYDAVQAEVVKLIDRSAECLNRLKQIALKPDPLSTPDYIDMLIEGETSEAKSGWKQRVQYLRDMRGQAEILAKVDRGENLLQSPTTEVQHCNQTKRKASQDQTEPSSLTDQGETGLDANSDRDETDSDCNMNTDQDSELDTNPDQDKTNSDTNTDQDVTDSDTNTDQDSELDTNPDQDKTNSDTNTDQDVTDSDTNTDQDSELDTNPDQDKTDSDTNTDQDVTDSDCNMNKHHDSELDTNPDQDKTDSDTNTDQDSELVG